MTNHLWAYADLVDSAQLSKEIARVSSCLFCDLPLRYVRDKYKYNDIKLGMEYDAVALCDTCGWWVKTTVNERPIEPAHGSYGGPDGVREVACAAGRLLSLDTPVQNLCYKQFEEHMISPALRVDISDYRQFSDEVSRIAQEDGAVLKHLLRDSSTDSYYAFLNKNDQTVFGIRFSRNDKSLFLEQVNALSGVSCANGDAQGVYLTTASFIETNHRRNMLSSIKGFPLDLEGAPEFLLSLQVRRRSRYGDVWTTDTPFHDVPLVKVDHQPLRR